MRHLTIRVTSCLWAVLWLASTSSALDIRVTFDDDNSLPEDFPNFDPDAALLGSMVEYAANVYENIIDDNHVLDIKYRWDLSLPEDFEHLNIRTGLHTYQAEEDGRETSALIRFVPDADWFIDPTPTNDSEFNMAPVLFRELSSTEQAARFGGDVPELFEAGYRGDASPTAPADAQNNFDLLTIVFHEMGHALGMSGNLSSLLDETEIESGDTTGDYDINPQFVAGNFMHEFVRNDDTPNNRAHLVGAGGGTLPGPAVMSFVGRGERRRPSAADIFAMSASSDWIDLDLPRKTFLTGNSWNIGGNWLGGALPGLGDDVFLLEGATVFLTGAGRAHDLLIVEDALLITNGNIMQVNGTATVGNAFMGELLVGGLFGPVDGAVLDADRVVVNPTGTLKLLGNTTIGEEAVVMGGEVVLEGGKILVPDQAAGQVDSSIQVASAFDINVGSGSRLNLNGNLTGSADLVKKGVGKLVLGGDNGAWSGELRIDEGSVVVAPGNGLGNVTTVNVRTAGVLDLTAVGQVFGGIRGVGTVLVGPADIFFGANNADTVFSGFITPPPGGIGGFAKVGTGTTTLTDAVALDVSRVRSFEGGTLAFSGETVVSTSLLEAAGGSTIRIDGDAHVVAFASVFSSGLFELFGGTFTTTAFDGTLLNQGGTISPGIQDDSTRVLNISDNFNNDADSTLVIDVGGLTPGEYDQLRVPLGPPGTGKFVGLSGTVEINLLDGFVPNLGDTFTIAVARSVGATWDTLIAPIFNGNTFDLSVVNAGPNEMHAVLQVIEAPLVAGDYNADGIVNAADYVRWRDNLGSDTSLPNDDTAGVALDDYDRWVANFGQGAGTASSSSLIEGETAAVPEPATAVLMIMALAGLYLRCQVVRRLSGPV